MEVLILGAAGMVGQKLLNKLIIKRKKTAPDDENLSVQI